MIRQLNRSISINDGPPTAHFIAVGFSSMRSATYQMSTSISYNQITFQVVLFMAGLDLHICYLHCKCVGKIGEPRCSVNSNGCKCAQWVEEFTVIWFLMGSGETRADIIQDWVTIKRWGASNYILSHTLHLENNDSKVVRRKESIPNKIWTCLEKVNQHETNDGSELQIQ